MKWPNVNDGVEVLTARGRWVVARVDETDPECFWVTYAGGRANFFRGDEGLWRWPRTSEAGK